MTILCAEAERRNDLLSIINQQPPACSSRGLLINCEKGSRGQIATSFALAMTEEGYSAVGRGLAPAEERPLPGRGWILQSKRWERNGGRTNTGIGLTDNTVRQIVARFPHPSFARSSQMTPSPRGKALSPYPLSRSKYCQIVNFP